jgi:GDPmannose 4,6-dehydratase
MWRILQQSEPEDFVIATGVTTTVREFVRLAFREVGISIEFRGSGIHEKGYVTNCEIEEYDIELGKIVVAVDPSYFRPTEVDLLIGDPNKAKKKLGWSPKYNLQELVKEMMEADMGEFQKTGFIHLEQIIS